MKPVANSANSSWPLCEMTLQEQEEALTAANIPLDPMEWKDEQAAKANAVLRFAELKKRLYG